MIRRTRVPSIVLAMLAVTGAAFNAGIAPVWATVRGRQPAWRLDGSFSAAGQGVTLALLGGFRALVADLAWIRMYTLWERRDLPGTETLIRFVAAVDPRPIYFWLNGARIIAYDLPVWRIAAAGGYDVVPPDQQEAVLREHGQRGLRHLDTALPFHGRNPDYWVERANIELNRLRDLGAAAESYRRAWEQPRAPYYVARLHAELLRRQGRKAEARDWLTRLHPTLPREDEGAGATVVLQRIRELERELGVPHDQSYQPPP